MLEVQVGLCLQLWLNAKPPWRWWHVAVCSGIYSPAFPWMWSYHFSGLIFQTCKYRYAHLLQLSSVPVEGAIFNSNYSCHAANRTGNLTFKQDKPLHVVCLEYYSLVWKRLSMVTHSYSKFISQDLTIYIYMQLLCHCILLRNKQLHFIWPNNKPPSKQVTLGTFFHWIIVVSICHPDFCWGAHCYSGSYWFLWVCTQDNTVLSIQDHREGEISHQIFSSRRLASSLRKLKQQWSCYKLRPWL